LVSKLLDEGAQKVIALDNLRCGTWNNLAEPLHKYGPKLIQQAVDFAEMDLESLEKTLAGVDYLFHLAAEKHNQSKASPEHVLNVNVIGTHRLFQAAVHAKVRKTIFTSSLYAYGAMQPPAMTESQIPAPHTVYGVSKLTGEHLLHYLHAQHGMNYTALRLFFVYGPRQYAGMGYKSVILSNFERILQGEPPVIFGNGEQALDYTYVDDVVRALIAGLNPNANGHVINIGSGVATSVNALTCMMMKTAGSAVQPINASPDWTAGSCRVSDNSKARRILGWEPTIPLEAGLHSVYRWLTEK
jgi:UDP-glucose 4-epimerase